MRATFTVGVIYGPSGCGKSSLVKAGLLPQAGQPCADRVRRGDRRRNRGPAAQGTCGSSAPTCPPTWDSVETVGRLRRGQGIPAGKKVLIVLDQFEQWLHAKRGEQDTELAQALRQCDGEHVQCLVLVRDDFWLALSRFMGDLDIELLQGQNIAAGRSVRSATMPAMCWRRSDGPFGRLG